MVKHQNPELLQRVRGGFTRQSLHDKHVENHARKYETLQGKKALLQMWEERDDCDHEYLLELRRRVRNLTGQLAAMRPGKDED